MEKPRWHRRSSRYVVESPYMRLRVDELELPDGTVAPEYYVREAPGYVTVMALTPDDQVVLVRQYRYGSDAIHLELPAGMLDDGEDPLACAVRELAEETGFTAERWEPVGEYLHEPVRSPARAYIYIGFNASRSGTPRLDPTEHLEVELAALRQFRAMLKDGTIDAGGSIAAGYRCLEYLTLLSDAETSRPAHR